MTTALAADVAAAGSVLTPARPARVLVFPGSSEVGLEVNRALGWCKEVELLSAGTPGAGHAPFVFRDHLPLPDVNDPRWPDAIDALVDAHRIDLIVPAHDDAVVALAERAESLRAGVVTSPLDTCRTVRSKRATYRHLTGHVAVPLEYEHLDEVVFPAFVKPDRGQGSNGTAVVASRSELDQEVRRIGGWDAFRARLLCLELLPGDEYTVDCFSDRDRGLLFHGARRRDRMRSGIAVSSRPVGDDGRFAAIAGAIDAALELHGAWFFQVKERADGELVLLEVAARIAGTSGLTRVRGVNLPLLSLYEHLRIPVEVRPLDVDVVVDRALVSRYRHDIRCDHVYVDLDDTLVVRGRVNPNVIRFLYQALGDGARLSLVTRHGGDLEATLRRHRLDGIFDEVHHLVRGEDKADVITSPRAVLIDDSHRERERAARRGIIAVDPSMLELLLDDRT